MVTQKQVRLAGMNSDDNLELLAEGDYLNLMNGRIGFSEFGKSLRIENIPGTTALVNSKYPPYGTNICIGSCIDIEGQRLIWFIYNTSNDHGIYCYDFRDKQIYAVLYDSQIIDTYNSGLGFDKNFRIDRNCKVDQGLLYWTDNKNEPKKINIDSGIKLNQPSYVSKARAYTTLQDSYEITLIRRPPTYAPAIEKKYNSTYANNFISKHSWQFSWQYVYFDGEISVLGEYSPASMLNLIYIVSGTVTTENYNYVQCDLPLAEKIPQTARIIRLIAKNQATGVASVVKTFDKLINEAPFIAHNAGTSKLTFDYYGDLIGETIDAADTVKPYDSVPLLSKTAETAVNRLFLGNNLSGYDTPTKTSLSVAQVLGDSTAHHRFFKAESSYQVGIVFYDKARRKCGVTTLNDGLFTTGQKTYPAASDCTFYDVTIQQADINDATGNTNGKDGIVYVNYTSCSGSSTLLQYTFADTFYNQLCLHPADITSIEFSYWKNDNQIVASSYATNNTISCDNGGLTQTYTVDWQLSNANPSVEIPDWAYYYSIVRTKNLKTRYFIDSLSNDNKYATKVNTAGVITYTYSPTFATGAIYLAIDSAPLVNSGLGYVYNEGDMCVLLRSTGGKRYEVPVVGTDGNYILVSLTNQFNIDNASLTGTYFTYEIYTPYTRSENEPYYEVGNIYPVTNPTLSTRQYSTLTGSLIGDIYAFQRLYIGTYYWVEAMSPNDLFYQNWYTDGGFINFVTLLGQTQNSHEIRYSNVFTPGTSNNGLSTFEALNFKTVPLGTGNIQKLQLASKTEEQGVIMLSIDAFQTVSCYLGEVQVIGSSKNAFLAQDASVIGTMNVLKGMYGTTHPETVIEYLGNVFWYDLNNGAIVQYSANGLYPVSSFKMVNFFSNYAKDYANTSAATLDTLNGFHHIPTAINPFTKRFQVTTPALIATNAAAVLPSYDGITPSYASSIINRFNPYTKLAQTVCLDIIENRWKEVFEYAGEWYDYFENQMIGFKNGTIYTHETNTANLNTFYGTQYPIRYCLTPNQPLSSIKDVVGITVEGSVIPDYSVCYSVYPWEQITDLINEDYRNQEGVMYSSLFRDRLSPNVVGSADVKLYYGDIVKSKTPLIMVEFQQYTNLVYISFIDIDFAESYGQTKILVNSGK
jgi:hypothetical protein